MSFILDALKKSENERRRTIGPSLADAPVRKQQGDRPWWAVAVAALLVINLGVLIVVLIRNRAEVAVTAPAPVASTPAPAVQQPVTAQPTQQAPASSPPTNPAVRSLAEEAGGSFNEPYQEPGPETGATLAEAESNPALAAASNVPQRPPIVRPIEAPAVAPLDSRATFPSRGAGSSPGKEVLPTLNALAASGTSLPDLHLDIHVYSDKPPERFVFVNMKKYLEGQTLSEGPAVERITPEGAILNQQGLRFLLPRQ